MFLSAWNESLLVRSVLVYLYLLCLVQITASTGISCTSLRKGQLLSSRFCSIGHVPWSAQAFYIGICIIIIFNMNNYNYLQVLLQWV